MQRIYRLTMIVERQAQRFRTTLLVVGIACFAIITADHAKFIDLPTLAKLPLWIGIILNVLRWAIWEGMLKTSVRASMPADRIDTVSTDNAQR